MPNLSALSIDPNSTRGEILSKIDPGDFAWALPIMRMGYAGRGLVYLCVAGVSLWSIAQGGRAEGTQSALQSLSGGWGTALIALIVAGLVAYGLWRSILSIWDLEAHGTTAKGLIARTGMIVTGLIHVGIAVLAAGIVGSGMSGGAGSSRLSEVMQTTWGSMAIGIAGAVTIGAAVYYFRKAYNQSYRDTLSANRITTNWNWVLRLGVAAQGFIIAFIGGLMIYAAFNSDASDLGGLGTVFDWLGSQPFGQVLSVALCLGLLGFALFCFVNALYRIVPKAAGDDTTTVTSWLKGT